MGASVRGAIFLYGLVSLALGWPHEGLAAAPKAQPESAAGLSVVMPFRCSVRKDALIVKPSSPRYYSVIGRDTSQSVELCTSDRGARAIAGADRSLTCFKTRVHDFTLACEGGPAAWVDVAAVGAALLGGGVRYRQNTMRLQFRGRLRPWPEAPCLKGDWPHKGAPIASGLARFPDVGCEAVGTFEPTMRSLAMPKGFAPLAELGARLVPRPTFLSEQASVAPPTRRPQVQRRLAALATALPVAPNDGSTVAPSTERRTVQRTQVAAAGPRTTMIEIRSYVPGETQADFERALIVIVIGLVLIAGALSGVGWFVADRRRRPFRAADAYEVILRRDGVDLERPDAQLCGELCKSAQNLVLQVHDTIDELQGVAPLRRTLLREIRDLEYYLASLIATTPEDDTQWRRMRTKLQRIVNDILRLKDIVEAAYRSLSVPALGRGLPRDKAEAYEAIGANPTTNERILKKLIDALRATWHPDHAADEEDRRMREERIKQINVAWDLISEKRVEA